MKIALKDNEHIRQIYRQNPFVLLHPVGLALVVVVLIGYLTFRFDLTGWFRLATVIAMILVALNGLKQITIWHLNQYVVTNQRLIQYVYKSMFDETVTETPHERILNVSYKKQGVIPAMVGYGDVVVQVVGLMEPIILKNISQPMEIKDYLWEMHKRIAKDTGNAVFPGTDAAHVEELVGYTKHNQIDEDDD